MVGMTERFGKGRDRRPVFDVSKLFDRLPPHSLEAEMALLGSLILEPRALADVITLVPTGESFYSEAHATIFEALKDIYDERNSGDLQQLQERLRDRTTLDDVGGVEYLVELAECAPSARNAQFYAESVREKSQLRKLIETASGILYNAYHSGEAGGGAREVLDAAEKEIMAIAEKALGTDERSLALLLQDAIKRLMENEGRTLTGLDSGFLDLNEITSGLQPGELIIVAGRPSMGKTAFALNLAEQVALAGQPHADDGPMAPVGFFSMEMSRDSVVQRLLCARANVDSARFRRNRLSQQDFAKLMDAAGELADLPIHIDDTPGLTALGLRAKARRMVQQHGVKCLMVDYLQLMSAPGLAREGRQQEVSAISRGVKALARELSVPVVCLAQLNRGAELREGHRPRMADLRESGSIEQDADVILLLHREEYYHKDDEAWLAENPDKIGVAEVIVAKQRNGPTGVVKLTWDSSVTRFKNFAGVRDEFGGGPPPPAPSSYQPPSHGTHGGEAPPFDAGGGGSSFRGREKTGPESDFRDGGGDTIDL